MSVKGKNEIVVERLGDKRMRLVPGSAMRFSCDCKSHKILVLQFPILSVGMVVAFLEAQ